MRHTFFASDMLSPGTLVSSACNDIEECCMTVLTVSCFLDNKCSGTQTAHNRLRC